MTVWITDAIEVSLKIGNRILKVLIYHHPCSFIIHVLFKYFSEKLSPNIKYGKIENNTEVIITLYKGNSTQIKSISNQSKSSTMNERRPNSLYQRLFNKESNIVANSDCTDIIDSRTLDNVPDISSVDENSTDSIGSSKSMNLNHRESRQKLYSQIHSFESFLAQIANQDQKTFSFRSMPRAWCNFQMSDVFVSKVHLESPTIFAMNYDFINENNERMSRDYYVNLKTDPEIEKNSTKSCATIELSDILMAKLNIKQFSRVTLCRKNTVINFLEKIEVIPTPSKFSKQEIIEEFKWLLVKNTSASPLLINQDQIFRLCRLNLLVSVKLFPESFKYCLCDAEILRENKIFVSDQTKDLTQIMKIANEISSSNTTKSAIQNNFFFIRTKELTDIVEDCVQNITAKNCLNKKNQLRKLGNFLILGKYFLLK